MARSRTALLLLPLVLLAGCASTAGVPSPWSAAAEHEELERRLLALERQATHDRLEIERLQRRIAELESAAPRPAARTPSPAPRPTSAPAPLAVPATAGGRLDLEAPPPVPPPTREEAPATPATPPAALPDTPSDAPPDAPPDAITGIEESELEESAVESSAPAAPGGASYENGLRLLRDGQPEAAERELAAFAAAAPESDLADNALFWVGEARLLRGDAAGALEAYREAIDRYPEGNKVPDALFKLGVALAASGADGSAREAWAELVRRFPDTAAAERARDRLAAP